MSSEGSAAKQSQPLILRKPTPLQLVRAAEVVLRYAESLDDPTCQEVSMARYTADNMRIAAIAEQSRRGVYPGERRV